MRFANVKNPVTKQVICTVTNDLNYDQRMQRICSALQETGYEVTLVGRELPDSLPLLITAYKQVRLPLKHTKGKRFYAEYNWKLFQWLKKYVRNLPNKSVAVCAIDLDTILPVFQISRIFQLTRVYDAHELFTEMTEVKRRKHIHYIWSQLQHNLVPQFNNGYTVNEYIAQIFYIKYKVNYWVIRNMPLPANVRPLSSASIPDLPPRFFLYQGAVNEGRGFSQLVQAMKEIDVPVVIAGTGNFIKQLKAAILEAKVTDKFIFLGQILPNDLIPITRRAFAGLTLFENTGINQYNSLANRYFDYVQAGIPQLCVNYPEYAALQKQFAVAHLIDNVEPATIVSGMKELLVNSELWNSLSEGAKKAAEIWNWDHEKQKLIEFWQKVFPLS